MKKLFDRLHLNFDEILKENKNRNLTYFNFDCIFLINFLFYKFPAEKMNSEKANKIKNLNANLENMLDRDKKKYSVNVNEGNL